MKIIQINCVYPNGSTGKIVYDLHTSFLNKGYESIVIFGNGKNINEPFIYRSYNSFFRKINTMYTYLTGNIYAGSLYSTMKIIKKIKREKPDIVHLHSINGHMVNIYKLLKYLKKNKVNTVITNHGEFFYTGSYTHVPEGSTQWLTGRKEKYPGAKKLTNSLFFDKTYYLINRMKKSFKNFESLLITSVSPWVNNRSLNSFVLKNKLHQVVLNGIESTNIFYPRKTEDLKKKLKIENEKIILHVTSGANNPIKGFNTIIELANTMSSYKFLIIGLSENDKFNLPSNCINLGKIYNQDDLASYYSLADLTVLTSRKETFSMIVAESLSCGTPIVGYEAGGPESITIDEYSEFVPFGNFDKLQNTVKSWVNFKNNNEDFSLIARKKYSKDNMTESYLKAYWTITNRN